MMITAVFYTAVVNGLINRGVDDKNRGADANNRGITYHV
jgi:hypothetical protein